MNKDELIKWYLEYNNIFKENDDLYRNAARQVGLSEGAFWILYVLRMSDGVITQSGICQLMCQPKQTINSALKKLETEGYIQLSYIENRRSKQVLLTPAGQKLAKQTVDHTIKAEHEALLGLEEQERADFLSLFQKYTGLLKERLDEKPE